MAKTLLGWAFCALIYFKVAFDVAFYKDISVVGAIIVSIVLAAFIKLGAFVYARRLLRYNLMPWVIPAPIPEIVAKTLPYFLAMVIAFGVICSFIIFGFSKELSRKINFTNFRDYYGIRTELIAYWAITATPLLLHYAMCVWGTCGNVKYHRTPAHHISDLDLRSDTSDCAEPEDQGTRASRS